MRKVPKLRFKEFADEWEEKKLGEISEIKGGYAFKSNKFLNTPSKYQVIKMGNLYQNKLLLDRNPSFMEEINEKEKEYLLNKNDIILTLTGTVGKKDFGYSYKINNENNLLLNQRLACIKMKHEKYSADFFKDIIKHESFLDKFFELSIGGTGNQANVSIKDIENIKINIPIFSEQQKIANFLSSVDKKISLTEEKLELFREYKKGVMQKIFSQELRFKDNEGNDYPEWEEKRLNELVVKLTNGISLNQNLEKKGYRVTRIETISMGKIDINRIGFVLNDKNLDEYKLNIGDLLFSNINSVEHIGKIAYVDKDYNLYHGMNLLRIVFKEQYNSKYFYYILITNKYKKIFEKLCNKAVSQASINQTELGKIKIKFPILEEQQKIANFLSSIDEKIEKIENKLENLKEFKKGLLQQMFV